MSKIATQLSEWAIFGWSILFVISVVLILFHAALLFTLPGEELLFVVSIALSIISAVVLYIPYRRGEKWAWYTIWAMVIPYALVIFFAPEFEGYLVIAILMALGQLLTWGAFFSQG
jgi:hypothetical protein